MKQIKKIWADARQRAASTAVWQGGLRFAIECNSAPFLPQILLILLYRGCLDVIYVFLLSPKYAYSGFICEPKPLTLAASYAIVLLLAPFAAELQNRELPSAKLVAIMHYLYFIPLTSYCSFCDPKASLLPIGTLYWMLLLFWEFKLPVLSLKPLAAKHSRLLFALLSIFSAAVVLYVSGRYTGFRLTLDFLNVYDIRAEAAAYSMPRLLSYLLNWQTILLSTEILYWLSEKQYLPAFGLVIVYLFYFSIGAHKSVFFFLLLILAAAFLYRKWMLRWCVPCLMGIGLLAFGEYILRGSVWICSLFIRRVMYIPVQLADYYQKYFSENPILYFRDGILHHLGYENPYSLSIVRLLGEYEGNMGTNANNGLLGDLFSNLPVPAGLLLMPLLLVGCFRLLDLTAARKDERIYLPFCLFFANTFINSGWSTTLLTHGFLLSCLLLYIFPKKENTLQ